MNKRKSAWMQMLLRETFTAKDIADATNVSIVQCHTTIRVFISRGILTRVKGVGVYGNPRKLTVVLGKNPQFGSGGTIPKIYKKNGRQQLWNNIKIARTFTIESLLSSIDVKITSAQEYVKCLKDAGYIVLIKEGKKQKGVRNGKNLYRLVNDTGRLAPRKVKDGMWDQNENALYPIKHQIRSNITNSSKETQHDVAQ
jgi:predicted transcriptional regulator